MEEILSWYMRQLGPRKSRAGTMCDERVVRAKVEIDDADVKLCATGENERQWRVKKPRRRTASVFFFYVEFANG